MGDFINFFFYPTKGRNPLRDLDHGGDPQDYFLIFDIFLIFFCIDVSGNKSTELRAYILLAGNQRRKEGFLASSNACAQLEHWLKVEGLWLLQTGLFAQPCDETEACYQAEPRQVQGLQGNRFELKRGPKLHLQLLSDSLSQWRLSIYEWPWGGTGERDCGVLRSEHGRLGMEWGRSLCILSDAQVHRKWGKWEEQYGLFSKVPRLWPYGHV